MLEKIRYEFFDESPRLANRLYLAGMASLREVWTVDCWTVGLGTGAG
jgi:hypothetical protein